MKVSVGRIKEREDWTEQNIERSEEMQKVEVICKLYSNNSNGHVLCTIYC